MAAFAVQEMIVRCHAGRRRRRWPNLASRIAQDKQLMKQHARSMPRLQGRSSAWLAVSRAGCCSRGARACEAIRAARLVGFRLDCARWRARCQSEQSSPARTSHTTMRLPRCTTVRAVPPLPPPPLPTPPAGRKKSLSLSLSLCLSLSLSLAADSSQSSHAHTHRGIWNSAKYKFHF